MSKQKWVRNASRKDYHMVYLFSRHSVRETFTEIDRRFENYECTIGPLQSLTYKQRKNDIRSVIRFKLPRDVRGRRTREWVVGHEISCRVPRLVIMMVVTTLMTCTNCKIDGETFYGG